MKRTLPFPIVGHLYRFIPRGCAVGGLQRSLIPVSRSGVFLVRVSQPCGALERHLLQSGAARYSRKSKKVTLAQRYESVTKALRCVTFQRCRHRVASHD